MALVDELLAEVKRRIVARPQLPESTYRLQFHAGFTFRDAAAIVPYLHDLGITHVYASPYLKARPGSTHGYDVVDHCALNPELGTEEDYNGFVDALERRGMSHILDIVPNHAGIGTNENNWWNDVLANGRASKYAEYFDISWQGSPRPELHNRVLLPVLGEPYAQALESGKLRLVEESGCFFIAYYDRRFPLSTVSRERVAQCGIGAFQGRPGAPHTFDALDELLNEQHYRLAFWRTAPDEINYRRFFDINDLAALRMEREEVFEATHTLILRLLAQGKVSGLRVDHPDGLYDPLQYFRRLQRQYLLACVRELAAADDRFRGLDWNPIRTAVLERAAAGDRPDLYVVAEKILARDEALPSEWPVSGTTGYDFLNMVNGIFVQQSNEEAFTRFYQEWTHDETSFADVAYEKKKLILKKALGSELHRLARQLDRLAQQSRYSRDHTLRELLENLLGMIACFPVYRSYISEEGVRPEDREYVEAADVSASQRHPTGGLPLPFVRDTLLLRFSPDERLRPAQHQFAARFQQLIAPVTAKGVEDTAFYVYNRLISLNEVGGNPDHFGTSPDALHAYLANRQVKWPYALSTLSTHDTKRSEDVRARINILSEMPDEWRNAVQRWSRINKHHRQYGYPRVPVAPTPNDEYLIYQTLIGAWPVEPMNAEQRFEFIHRIKEYIDKAAKEAKVHTCWTDPTTYGGGLQNFVARILLPATGQKFLDDFAPFQRRVSHLGMLNSLAQTVLRLAAPGVPDTYQGTELWDFSLVDPDNRRPVDYARRQQVLRELQSRAALPGRSRSALVRELMDAKEDGRIKLYVTWRGLAARRDHPGLFSGGDYLPLRAVGARAEHVFAFARRQAERWAIAIAPRLLAPLTSGQDFPAGPAVWQDTQVLCDLPLRTRLRNVFSDEVLCPDAGLSVANALTDAPVALMVSE